MSKSIQNSGTQLPKLSVIDGKVTTTSNKLARDFGKRHDTILRKIQTLDCSKDFHDRNFVVMIEKVKIGNGATRENKTYQITRDGFVYLAMGFTGKKAAKFKESYIHAFNQMEAELQGKPQPQAALPQTNPYPNVKNNVVINFYHKHVIGLIRSDQQTWIPIEHITSVADLDYRTQKSHILNNPNYQTKELSINNDSRYLCLPLEQTIDWLVSINPQKFIRTKQNALIRAQHELPKRLRSDNNCLNQFTQTQQPPTLPNPQTKPKPQTRAQLIKALEKHDGEELVIIKRRKVERSLKIYKTFDQQLLEAKLGAGSFIVELLGDTV